MDLIRSVLLEEEERMAADPPDVALDGGRRAALLTGGLAVAGAGKNGERRGTEDIRSLEPVGGGEGLGAESVAAVDTAEPGDAARTGLADEPAMTVIAPTEAREVEA